MLFDFKETYKDYSNAALLAITMQPDKYQPGAVAAAQELLESRTVTEADHNEAAETIAAPVLKPKRNNTIREPLKAESKDLLQSVLAPEADARIEKWFRILLIVVALQGIWIIYQTIKMLMLDMEYGMISWRRLGYIDILWTPIAFWLLWLRKKGGWIMLFASSLFAVISNIFQFSSLFSYMMSGGGPQCRFLLFTSLPEQRPLPVSLAAGYREPVFRKRGAEEKNRSAGPDLYPAVFGYRYFRFPGTGYLTGTLREEAYPD